MIFVIDSSVLFDLERGQILDLVLPKARFETPEILMLSELADQVDDFKHLRVVVLTDAEETLAQSLQEKFGRRAMTSKRQQRRDLSVVDCALIALATRQERVLLVGDARLREIAEQHAIECRGLLGLLELLDTEGLCERTSLVSALLKLQQHPRARLPKVEIERLIERWQ